MCSKKFGVCMSKIVLFFRSLCFSFCIIGSLIILPSKAEARENSKITILATTFPIYDWLREIVGNSQTIEVDLLLKSGVDLHSYQPTIQDITKIVNSNIFIHNGGESDAWVQEVLEQNINQNQVVVNLMSLLGDKLKLEEVVEGMEAHSHDGHHHVHSHEGHSHDHEGHHHGVNLHLGYDEHVWLSLKNTQSLVRSLSVLLGHNDKENIKLYRKNAKAYIERLQALDEEYKKVVDASSRKTILVADRFPFRYLVDDYNIEYFAAFVGCSAETEASFKTVTFLSGKINELDIDTLLIIDGSKDNLAKTIRSSSNNKDSAVLVLNSLQAVNKSDIDNNVTYFSVMQKNLQTLKQALAK